MKSIDKLFEKGKLFIKQIEPKDKLFLIYHTDIDGLVSAALTFIALERLGIKVSKTIPRSIEGRKEIPKDLKECDKAIILDLPLTHWHIKDFKEIFRAFEKQKKEILIIDHHPSEDFNTEKIVYINPRLEEEEIYQPTSYIVYKFFSKLINLKDKEWLSVLGTIGDFGLEDCKDLLKKWIKVRKKSEILNTKFWKAAIKLRGAIFSLNKNKVFKIFTSAKNLEELNRNKEILSSYEKYRKIYFKGKGEFWKNVKEFKESNLIISRISEKVGSDLTNDISARRPNKIIILLEKRDDGYKIHSRYQEGKIHIGNLMEKLRVGGGHRQAAGGRIQARDLENFEKRLIEELKKMCNRKAYS